MTRGSTRGEQSVARQQGDRNTGLKQPAFAATNPAISFGKLRGGRYLRPANEWLAKFNIEEFRFLDYQETAAWRRAKESHC